MTKKSSAKLPVPSISPRAAARLTGLRPDGETCEWLLAGEETVLGRTLPADILLPWPRISRRHALLRRTEGGYLLVDLGSTNGTFVDGQPVGKVPHRLQDGARIVLGGAIELQFHDPGETLAGPRLGRLHGVWIDEVDRAVWVDGRPVHPPLSDAQHALLSCLYRVEGQVVSRDQIVAAVWPGIPPAGVSEEAVDGLIKRLRARLRETRPEQEYIRVVRGHRLEADPAGSSMIIPGEPMMKVDELGTVMAK